VTAGEFLRTVRRRHGLTQRQLAARARTSQAAISRIERGIVSPTVDTLAELLESMSEELRLEAEPIDYGHDRTLFAVTLRRSVAERIDFASSFAHSMNELRGIAYR